MLTIEAQTAASVSTPPSGQQRLFLDISDGILKTKDSLGVVRVVGVGTATDLATTGSPVVIDSGAAPSAGYTIIATAGPGSPIATWQNPRTAGISTPYLQTTLQSGAISASWGELVRIDLSGGNATVSLPTAVGFSNSEIGFKIVGATAGNTVTITPFGAQTIDGLSSFAMTTDNETLVLRSDGTNVMEWT